MGHHFASFRASSFLALAFFIIIAFSGCSMSVDSLKKTIAEHPEIVTDAIEKNPEKFARALQRAGQAARRVAAEEQQKEMAAQQDADLKAPKKVNLEGRAIRGQKDAPILVVAFSDFECPYCKMGHETIEQLKAKYGDKMAYAYRHIPLNFHPMAMPAAARFEAIAMQSPEKAFKFHDIVFKEQAALKGGEKALDEMAKKAGADLAKMKKDMMSEEVKKRIEADKKEGQELDFTGTPAFVVNGVRLRGALPLSAFESVIEKTMASNRDVSTK